MKNRNGAKGGRKTKKRSEGASPRKNKGDTTSPALRSVEGVPIVVHLDLTNSIVDWRLVDEYEMALRDLLHFYDRATGSGDGVGWTATEVRRLEEIRKLIEM